MAQLRMWAIGIDEVHDMVGAPPDLAAQLRDVAASHLGTGRDLPSTGWLSRLGPLFRDPAPTPPRDAPSHDDVETLLAGRYVAPERTGAAWQIVEAWLDDRSRAQLTLPLDLAAIDRLDMELARAGLPSDRSVGHLLARDAQLPLRPLPEMRVGYVEHAQALATADALRRALPDLDGEHRTATQQLATWLADLGTMSAAAQAEGRPSPDVLAVVH